MIKLILLAKRKEGMSREAFIDYYENIHIPMGNELYPFLTQTARRRNYVDHTRKLVPQSDSGEFEYDVISEVIWHDREMYERRQALDKNPELAKRLVKDEEKLFQRESMRLFMVDCYGPDSDLENAGENTKSRRKFLWMAKRKKGLTREAFIDHYENVHIPLAAQAYPTLTASERRRNYIDHERVSIPKGFSGELQYDVISELIWPDVKALDAHRAHQPDAELFRQLREDEANLFDIESIRYFFVDEYKTGNWVGGA